MDLLKRTVEIAFSPLGILTFLLAGGLLLGLRSPHSRAGRRLLGLGALLALILVFSPLAEVLMWELERDYPPMLAPPSDKKVDKIVVLSGYGEQHRGFPVTSGLSDETICRLAEGVRLHLLLPGSSLVVSGGVVRDGDGPVAGLMAEFLVLTGVPSNAIRIEGNSRNTYENLVEVRKIVGVDPFILVTSACDLRRATAVAHKLGMHPLPAPACIWALQHYPSRMSAAEWSGAALKGFAYPSVSRLSRIQWAYHEYLGLLWYRLLDRI